MQIGRGEASKEHQRLRRWIHGFQAPFVLLRDGTFCRRALLDIWQRTLGAPQIPAMGQLVLSTPSRVFMTSKSQIIANAMSMSPRPPRPKSADIQLKVLAEEHLGGVAIARPTLYARSPGAAGESLTKALLVFRRMRCGTRTHHTTYGHPCGGESTHK